MEQSNTLLAIGATVLVLVGTSYLVRCLRQSPLNQQTPRRKTSGRFPEFNYVEYDDCKNIPNVIVDGNRNDSTILELSHWRGNITPQELRDDVSAQVVFRFLEQIERFPDLFSEKQPIAVSNTHFDVDGLVGITSMIFPEECLARKELLIDLALAGDFATYKSPKAAKISFVLDALIDKKRSPFDQYIFSLPYNQRRKKYFEKSIPILLDICDKVETEGDPYQKYWDNEWKLVESTITAINNRKIELEHHTDLDLTLATIDPSVQDYHLMPIHNNSKGFRLLEFQNRFYKLTYRYESWVDYQSEPRPHERVDLTEFANQLTNMEKKNGLHDVTWVYGGNDALAPSLVLKSASQKGKTQSSIEPNTFKTLLFDYLRQHKVA